MTRIEELQGRIDDRSQRDPAAMLAWEELIRSWDERVRAGAVADTPREWPRALRLGELRYERTTPPNGELRVPATFGHDVATRHLLVARPPSEARRAAELLNAVALRYALGVAPDEQRLLLVDEYRDRRGLSTAVTELRAPRVSVFLPGNAAQWIEAREQREESALAVIHAAHRVEDEPDEERHGFTEPELESLLEHMRARTTPHVIVALAFDDDDAGHPARRAFDDARYGALRVRLTADGDTVLGAERSTLRMRFRPDHCPDADIARRLLRPPAG